MGDEECEPGRIDQAVNDEEELGRGVLRRPAWKPMAEKKCPGESEEDRTGDQRGEAEIKPMLARVQARVRVGALRSPDAGFAAVVM